MRTVKKFTALRVQGKMVTLECETCESLVREADIESCFPGDWLIAWLIQINIFVNKYFYGIFWNVHSKKIPSYVT